MYKWLAPIEQRMMKVMLCELQSEVRQGSRASAWLLTWEPGSMLRVSPGCKESLGAQGRCFTCLPSSKSSQPKTQTIRHGNEHTFTWFQPPALELPHLKPRGREASHPGHLFLSVDFEWNQCCLLKPLNLELIRKKKQKNGLLKKRK